MNKYWYMPRCGGSQEIERRRRQLARDVGRSIQRMALAIGAALLMVGCSQSNFTEYTKELVASQRAFCAQAAGGPYQGYIAAGSPDTSVSVSASGCIIKGSHSTDITVPIGSVTVSPGK